MPTTGQRVGEYILDEKVGAGSFGEVWRAHHHVWVDQLVAIKIPTDPMYVRNLQREGATVHRLVHPNIVRAIGFDPYCDPPYLTMEYIPGTSLRPIVRKRGVTIADTVAILRQVLAGLSHAHGQGMVHRDVKPENILIHERAHAEGFGVEGVVKVTDFDLGQTASRMAVGSILYSQSMNSDAARDIAGTLDYMSPEQRAGDELDARSDLYACGVILYELLTGEKPAGTDVPSDLNKAVPKSLDDVFRRSYARLDRRFSSAHEFIDALGALSPPPLPPHEGPGAVAQLHDSPASRRVSVACPQCHHPLDPDDQFCMHCGVQLVTTVRRCGKCGAYPQASDQYCIFCGDVLDGRSTRLGVVK